MIEGDQINKPIIVLGNPRSGTTLLRLILTSHPKIIIPPEAGFMCWLWDSFSELLDSDWIEEENLKKFSSAVYKSKKFETWNIGAEKIFKDLIRNPPISYRDACVRVYSLYAQQNKSAAMIWGDKNNFYTRETELLINFFSNGRFLHIIRDPRDVACSYKDMSALKSTNVYKPILPTDGAVIAKEWVKNNTDVIGAMERNNAVNYKLLRYEDLVANPEGESKILCEWLGIEYDKEMILFYDLNKKHSLEPKETLEWKMKTLEKVSTTQCGRYRNELPEEEKLSIENVAGSLMKKVGYLKS